MTLHLTTGLSLAVLAGALATAGDARGDTACRVDPATGLPVPVASPGICLLGADGSAGFVQRSADGWLIVTPSSGSGAGAGIASDGERLLQALDGDVRIVYCAPGKLGPGCFDVSRLSPGPGASVGHGRIQGNVVLGQAGLGCPGFVRVAGEVRSPAGEALALTASLTLVADAMQPGACAAHDTMAFGGTVPASHGRGVPPAIPRLSDDQWRILEQLMTLDAGQAALLETLLRVAPDDLPALQGHLDRDGAARVSATGRVSASGAGQAAAGDVTVIGSAITDLLDTVLSRLSSVSTRVNTLLARLPDRPDLRTLADGISPAKIREILDIVGDELQGLLDLVKEERDGFQSFVGSDRSCAAGTPCAAFRTTLVQVLDDLGELWTTTQKLRCIRKPDLRVIPFRDHLFRRLLTEKAPPILLYAMSRTLEAFDGWQTRLRDILDGIPVGLTELCDAGTRPLARRAASPSPAASACSGAANRICCNLRPEQLELDLNRVGVTLDLAKLAFAIAEEWTDDEKQIVAGATALAGATAGKSVKNPAKPLLATLKEVADSSKGAVKDILDKRKECADDEAGWELDLIRGNARVEYLQPADQGGKWEELYEMVGRRIDEMATQLDEGDKRIVNARSHWNEAGKDANKAKREGFNSLKKAHKEITRVPKDDEEEP